MSDDGAMTLMHHFMPESSSRRKSSQYNFNGGFEETLLLKMYTTASVIFTDLLGRGVELIIELQYHLKNLLVPTDIFLS